MNAEVPLQDLLDEVFPWCRTWGEELRGLFSAYVQAKQQQNLLDYDDLLLYWAQMMAVAAPAGYACRKRKGLAACLLGAL